MSYLSTTQLVSKLVPGVVYNLRKMSHGRRMAINAETAPLYAEIADIQREMEPLAEDIRQAEEDARIEPCTCKHEVRDTVPTTEAERTATGAESKPSHDEKTGRCLVPYCNCRKPNPTTEDAYRLKSRLDERETMVVLAKIWPARMRALVSSINGFPIDGVPATVESLLAEAPEPMVGELAREVNRLFNMGHDEQLAFLLPGTSGAAAAGLTNDTSAPTVGETSSTPSGTV